MGDTNTDMVAEISLESLEDQLLFWLGKVEKYMQNRPRNANPIEARKELEMCLKSKFDKHVCSVEPFNHYFRPDPETKGFSGGKVRPKLALSGIFW
jgi:hypothetical protein